MCRSKFLVAELVTTPTPTLGKIHVHIEILCRFHHAKNIQSSDHGPKYELVNIFITLHLERFIHGKIYTRYR